MACTSPLASILYSCGILGFHRPFSVVHGTQGIAFATPGFLIPPSARNERGDVAWGRHHGENAGS